MNNNETSGRRGCGHAGTLALHAHESFHAWAIVSLGDSRWAIALGRSPCTIAVEQLSGGDVSLNYRMACRPLRNAVQMPRRFAPGTKKPGAIRPGATRTVMMMV
jgi:hypothetical protein